MNVGIVGLGLIGGSVAKAIKSNTENTVFGCDLSEATVYKALLLDAIDSRLTDENVGDCDMLILAIYPNDVVKYIVDNVEKFKKGVIILDCCGVKEAVCCPIWQIAEKHDFIFVGAHPMAGIEFSGFEHSKKNLFNNASVIITPGPNTVIEVLERVKKLCVSIGFTRVQISTPQEHDRIIAYTSQMAHVVSSAYIKSETAIHNKGFSAGSYKDMTRVARLNEDMWCELFMLNRENLTHELEGMIFRLEEYKNAIQSGDEEGLTRLLREGREQKALADLR